MISTTMLLSSLGARDRTLFLRWALPDSSRLARGFWTILTNAGGAAGTLLPATLAFLLGGAVAEIARHALSPPSGLLLSVYSSKSTIGEPAPPPRVAPA